MRRGLFDVSGFRLALDRHRQSRSLSWNDVAAQAGVNASTLSRMRHGARLDVDSLAALVTWAGLDANEYLRQAPGFTLESD